MASWLSEKVSQLVKDGPLRPAGSAAPASTGAAIHVVTSESAGLPSAVEMRSVLEQRAQALTSPQSAAWLLNNWATRCSETEAVCVLADADAGGRSSPDNRSGGVWHLNFMQLLLWSRALELLLETASKSPALHNALLDTGDAVDPALKASLSSLAERLLVAGAMDHWPVLLHAMVAGDHLQGGPLPWGAWARKVLTSLKRCWRREALSGSLRRLDNQLVEIAVANNSGTTEIAGAGSDLLRAGYGGGGDGHLSKQGLRAALTRRRMPTCTAKALRMRNKTEILCDMCEKMHLVEKDAEAETARAEQLLADAIVASSSLDSGIQELSVEHEELGKTFSDVGSELQNQITSTLLTQESFAERRRVLWNEKENLVNRLSDIEAEVEQLDKETNNCSIQVRQLRERFNKNTSQYDQLVGGSFSSQQRLSDRKSQASAFQECARAAVEATKQYARSSQAELDGKLQRRKVELHAACEEYLKQECSRLDLAMEMLPPEVDPRRLTGQQRGVGGGEIGDEMAESMAAAGDAWRSSQAVLQRFDRLMPAGGPLESSPSRRPGVGTSAPTDGNSAGEEATEAALAFFTAEEAENRCECVDCGVRGAEWASVTYGAYLCMECAGRHRGLGVHLSFVRSLKMDRWTKGQVQRMQLATQEPLNAFLQSYDGLKGSLSPDAPAEQLRSKYTSKAVAFYRRRLDALCDGREASAAGLPPEAAEGVLPESDKSAAFRMNGS
eukprot:TRINITY_DN36304_c1_g1_i2.p1 TRINITY_DN36304_c1_g1~~TRINITY_DN36304_c1_g1_i2.p1  ORF type:complete len:727 (+),score=186.89 TRINITY_DN36304_c1_g1_i2:63-2243(+)